MEPQLWRQALIAGTAGAVSMAVLACIVALARDTMGHDWYAAARLTGGDLLIAAGFDENAPIEYRNADGTVEADSRYGLTVNLEAWWAREDILATVVEYRDRDAAPALPAAAGAQPRADDDLRARRAHGCGLLARDHHALRPAPVPGRGASDWMGRMSPSISALKRSTTKRSSPSRPLPKL